MQQSGPAHSHGASASPWTAWGGGGREGGQRNSEFCQSRCEDDLWDSEWVLSDRSTRSRAAGEAQAQVASLRQGACKGDGRPLGFRDESLFLKRFTGRSILFISELARNSWRRISSPCRLPMTGLYIQRKCLPRPALGRYKDH